VRKSFSFRLYGHVGMAISLMAAVACAIMGAYTSAAVPLVNVSELNDAALKAKIGGWCEDGCETTNQHCKEHTPTDCPAQLTCVRCSADTQQESCVDWGGCIPWISCSECVDNDLVTDPDVPCGTRKSGNCINGTCSIQIENDGQCAAVNRCHTN
jgi:hypothetical protein